LRENEFFLIDSDHVIHSYEPEIFMRKMEDFAAVLDGELPQ